MMGHGNNSFQTKQVIVGTEQGKEIVLYKLSNGNIDVVISNYGATIVSIHTPDRWGKMKNIVAGFNSPDEYKNDTNYLGCTLGRFANRIAYGKFKIDEKEFQLECNNGLNHLHGGVDAFHKKLWQVEESRERLTMKYHSKDGEEGYPGNLDVTVKFCFAEDNKFVISYTATTDKPTIINLTNHSYFNLSGFDDPTIYYHWLKINAKSYTPKNEHNIPTGEIKLVQGTPYDFTRSKLLGKDIGVLSADMGYDINYVLDTDHSEGQHCAELYEPVSGRLLKLFTTLPGLQVYTANWWDGSYTGARDKIYQKHGAVALETQSFPDAPNHPQFPTTILKPSEVYSSETVFQFLTA